MSTGYEVGPCSGSGLAPKLEARLEILPARGGPRSEVQSLKEILDTTSGWRD